jgi:hypothetical protein
MSGKPLNTYENKLLLLLFFTVGVVFFDRLSSPVFRRSR